MLHKDTLTAIISYRTDDFNTTMPGGQEYSCQECAKRLIIYAFLGLSGAKCRIFACIKPFVRIYRAVIRARFCRNYGLFPSLLYRIRRSGHRFHILLISRLFHYLCAFFSNFDYARPYSKQVAPHAAQINLCISIAYIHFVLACHFSVLSPLTP